MSAVPQSVLVLLFAWSLDATLGEPPTRFHPVVWMGHAIAPLKRLRVNAAWAEFALGTLYVIAVTVGFAGLAWWAQSALSPWPLLRAALELHILFGCFALKGLVSAGDAVRAALAAGNLEGARVGLGSLCSRDPSQLESHELAGAAIESLTENTSDSVVAPLFYFVLFGLPGAVFYRAANTLDAMVGYRGRYEYLGKTAARLDDVLNLIPARLTAFLLAFAGALLRLNVARGFSVWWSDRARTESPNAGHPMAMAAGLLSVQLDKRETYLLGRGLAPASAEALAEAQRLTRLTGWLAAGLALMALLGLGGRHGLGF
jgi:adenosylcobinamide-phosphate synthase